jgi:hypothetical protein
MYIADTGNSRIRKVLWDRSKIFTIAGNYNPELSDVWYKSTRSMR